MGRMIKKGGLMKKLGVIVVFIISLILIFSCAKTTKQCPTCNGTGKTMKSDSIFCKYEVVNAEVVNEGVFNPDYFVKVQVKNLSDADGNFEVTADFEYKDIGRHSEKASEYIRAHETKLITVHYDADKEADSYKYTVIPPKVIETKEEICPTCKGKGII
jgi:excinuclease UvrABC ATPase subunit